MNTSCNEIQNLFQSYRKKTLTKNKIKQFESHIEGCDHCRQTFELDMLISDKLENIPILSCPATVSTAIKNATYKNSISKELKEKIGQYLLLHKSLSISFATAVVILLLVILKPGIDKNGTPNIIYTVEEITKAKAQTKWSLAFTAKNIQKTEKQIIEDVLLKHLSGKIKQSIIKSIPMITGGQK